MLFSKRPLCLIMTIFLLTGCALISSNTSSYHSLTYPPTRTVNQVDNYHDIQVADPYRWLEDDNLAETKAWVETQNKITFDYFEAIPARSKIKERLTQLWNFEKYDVPFEKGGRYFYTKNDGLQNQNVVYTMKSLQDEPRVLIDPNTLSFDGTVALSGKEVSEDGRYMAYGLSSAGSDWQEWKVRDVETGQDLSDCIQWIKFFGVSWSHDGQGFYYSRYDEPKSGDELKEQNYYNKFYYHQLGRPQSEDELIYHRPDQKEWNFHGLVTEDGKYLIVRVMKGADKKNLIFYKDLAQPNAPMIELLNQFEAAYDFVGNEGPIFWFHTDQSALRYRVIAIDIRNPDKYHWKEVVAQSADTLQNVSLVGNRLICNYLHDAHSAVRVFGLDGMLEGEIVLPALGSAYGFAGKRDDMNTFYSFTSFTCPLTIYHYNIATGKSEVFRKPTVDFIPSDYHTQQVFYTSKDGTKVPMFVIHKKGLNLGGQNPTYLYGYGGFNFSLTPAFLVSSLVWMEQGGVFAIANLRGGGEYGKEWHEAGMKLNKQNVFDDFIAAAEWLISNKYTCPEKLAIAGSSNGGLLVGACITQHPELFGAALPAVGVLDMLRFHKFTIGWAWLSEYGSPENYEEFNALYAYSPYHRLRKNTKYPSTLITTANHDDRVVPAHSFKFAAALQAAHNGSNPVLIRVETNAGHGAGKPTTKIIEELADRLAFLVKELHMDVQ